MTIILIAVTVFISYHLFSFLVGTRSYKRQLQRDIKSLKKQMECFKESIIPFELEEYKILSYKPVIKKKSRGRTIFHKGFLSTIFQEPILSFASKERKYSSNILVLVESSTHDYLFQYQNNETVVYLNGDVYGKIDSEFNLIDNEGTLVGKLIINYNEAYHTIEIGGHDVAHINALEPDSKSSESDRLFSLFHDFKADDTEELLIISLYYLFVYKSNHL